MVKKLFKHEILAYLRIWIPMQIILQSAALLLRLLQFISSDNKVYEMVEGTSVFTYNMSLIVSFALVYVFSIVRFYKNLFTNEGYLSFTLPVSTSQHIFVKLLIAVLFMIMTVVGMLVSFAIVTAGELLFEFLRAGDYLIKDFLIQIKDTPLALVDVIFYIIEFGIVMLLGYALSLLLLYACISLGQTFRKNRIVGAVVVYFIYGIIMQVVGSVFSLILAFVIDSSELIEWLENTAVKYPVEAIHAFMSVAILLQLIVGAVYFAVTHLVISRKLNLE